MSGNLHVPVAMEYEILRNSHGRQLIQDLDRLSERNHWKQSANLKLPRLVSGTSIVSQNSRRLPRMKQHLHTTISHAFREKDAIRHSYDGKFKDMHDELETLRKKIIAETRRRQNLYNYETEEDGSDSNDSSSETTSEKSKTDNDNKDIEAERDRYKLVTEDLKKNMDYVQRENDYLQQQIQHLTARIGNMSKENHTLKKTQYSPDQRMLSQEKYHDDMKQLEQHYIDKMKEDRLTLIEESGKVEKKNQTIQEMEAKLEEMKRDLEYNDDVLERTLQEKPQELLINSKLEEMKNDLEYKDEILERTLQERPQPVAHQSLDVEKERNQTMTEQMKKDEREDPRNHATKDETAKVALIEKDQKIHDLQDRLDRSAHQLISKEKEIEQLRRQLQRQKAATTGELTGDIEEHYISRDEALQKVREDEKKDRTIVELNARLDRNDRQLISKEKEIEDLKERMRTQKGLSNDEYKDAIKELTRSRDEAIQKARDSEKEIKNLLTQKDQIIEDLTARLSAEMSNKAASNEQSLENVSVKNRPMNISTEYQQLCANQWHDAKNELDQNARKLKEEEKLKLLCTILVESENTCTEFLQVNMDKLKGIIGNPFVVSNRHSNDHSSIDVPALVTNVVGDSMRNNAGRLDFRPLIQIIVDKMSSHYKPARDVLKSKKMTIYIEECLKVTWKMVLQRPKMSFRQDGVQQKWQGDNKQEPLLGSSDPKDPSSVVKLYIYPALYHGSTMMVKGKVFLGKA